MKTISLWQPWASFIAAGIKPFETRDYPPPRALIGTRIAIHAAKRKPSGDDLVTLAVSASRAGDHAAMQVIAAAEARRLPLGAVVCTACLRGAYQCGSEIHPAYGGTVVEITKALPGSPTRRILTPDPWGFYGLGRWAWWLVDVMPLTEPLPWTGKQGWFDVSDERLPETRSP